MADPALEKLAARTMLRLRQVGVAAAALALVVADCLPLLRPELGAEPRHAAIAWLAVAFPLLVPVTLLERLPQLRTIARRDLLAGPAMILALVLFPALASLGWIGTAILSAAVGIALLEHLFACIDCHGVALLWLWVPAILLAGVTVAMFVEVPAADPGFDTWTTLLDPTGLPSGAHVPLLVTLLPLLVGSLAMAGTLIGGTLHERSTTCVVPVVIAMFLATTLPSLGFGPGSLSAGSEILAAALAALGLAPLFVLAADATAEPPVPETAIWGFALLLVLLLSTLDGAFGFAWAAILLSWIGRHYGIRSRFFQTMAVAALITWAGAETISGGWQLLAGASPLSMPFIVTMLQEGRTSAVVGSHVVAIAAILLSTLGLQRGAQDNRALAILSVLVAIVAIDVPILLFGFTEAQSLRCITALGWLVMPFLAAELLALIPSDPIFNPFRVGHPLRRG